MSSVTPSQTVGPFFAFGLRWLESTRLAPPDHPHLRIIEGTVFDGDGVGVPDALIETFQADAAGRFGSAADEGWTGFGRLLTDQAGRFSLTTVKPGAPPAAGNVAEAPHIAVSVFARGLLQRVISRIYFPDEEEANGADSVLQSIEPARRSTLVARAVDENRVSFDVHLQGEHETVFFNC